MSAQRAAEVLVEHWEVDVDNGGDQTEFYCDGCKETLAVGSGVDLDALHRAHLAAALSAAGCLRDDREGEMVERLRRLASEWRESAATGHPDCAFDGDCVACAADDLDDALRSPVTPDGGGQ